MMASQNNSFQRKLLYGFLLTGAVPLIICVALLLGIFQAELKRNARDAAIIGLASSAQELEKLLEDCAATMLLLQQNPLVTATLEKDNNETLQGIYDALYSLPQKLRMQADFSIFGISGKRLYTTAAPGSLATLPTQWGVLRAARQREGIVFLRGETAVGEGLLQAACAIRNEKILLGYVVMTMNKEQLGHVLEHWQDSGGGLLLLDAYWREIWSSRAVQGDQLADQLREQLLAGLPLTDQESYTCYIASSPISGFYLVAKQPVPVAKWVMRLLWLVSSLAIALCLGLCVAVSMGLSRQLFAPIRALNRAMGEVEDGNLETRLPVSGTDEMAQLSGRFNRMTERLSSNLKESLRRQKELNEARIRMMQAQINPHFLYNTLDTVKWLGKINRVPEIATIASDLADILRWSISGQELVPLTDELKLLARYVEIQTIRFPGKFRIITQIDPDVQEILVPRLMLQPLVENAILHGFENMDGGLIILSAVKMGRDLSVTVRDNGHGMSEESLQRLEHQTSAVEGHLGLFNIREILRLHFGPDYGLRFVPVQGPGTCIRITLPAGEKGETPQ